VENTLAEKQLQLSSFKAQFEHEKQKNQQLALMNSKLSAQNYQYAKKTDKLRKDFTALMGSRRWRSGNALIRCIEIILLRGRKPGAADHMQQIFADLNLMHSQQAARQHDPFMNEDRLINKLEKDVHAFSNSTRWKLGNALLRSVEIMRFRGKSLLALDHMNQIFQDFHSESGATSQIKQRWINKLESDFQDILDSKRWKIGNSLVRCVEVFLLKKKKPMVTDHMEKLFDQFKQTPDSIYQNHDFFNENTPQFSTVNPSETSLKGDTYKTTKTILFKEKYKSNPILIPPIHGQEKNTPVLNLLIVSHSRMDSNSGYHVQHYANRLALKGIECIVAVPEMDKEDHHANKLFQVDTYKELEKNGLTFSNGRGPDIVHAWTPREHVRKFCQNLAAKYSFKTVIHFEDNEEYLTESSLDMSVDELKRLSLKKLDSLVPANRFHPIRGWEWLKKAHGLTLIIDTLQRFNPDGLPSIILPAPVDERLFYPRPINYELRRRLNIPDNHVVVCYTGNVRALKNQEALELYRGVDLLNRQGCQTTLIRTGTNFVPLGSDDSWYKDFEKSLGWVNRNEVPAVMAAADILVQPGWAGPFDDQRIPAKLPEYFAMGRPVILPRTNLGLKVEHLREGYVIDRADGEGIARAVVDIRKNKEVAGRLAAGGVLFGKTKLRHPVPNKIVSFYRKNILEQGGL
jgi:glycosyltransferase involved in cell wall biosynthesis